ncbi:hypothetical protein SESBI_40645 [Sesbania bispinosa]|nr:hypothetical protein SESBI_40645 [Sesbania bispinosa]
MAANATPPPSPPLLCSKNFISPFKNEMTLNHGEERHYLSFIANGSGFDYGGSGQENEENDLALLIYDRDLGTILPTQRRWLTLGAFTGNTMGATASNKEAHDCVKCCWAFKRRLRRSSRHYNDSSMAPMAMRGPVAGSFQP